MGLDERETLPGLLDEASQFEARNTGQATDYEAALAGAKAAFDERTADLTRDGAPAPCKALVWFTDGRYEVPAARRDAGVARLCEGNGLADELRADGVVTLTVALATNLSTADSAFLEGLTNGGGAGCGKTGTEATGLYIPVDEDDRLVRYFSELFPPPVVPASNCLGAGTFEISPLVNRFIVKITTGTEGASVRLAPPRGAPVRLGPSEPTRLGVAGGQLVQTWLSSRSVDIETTLPAGAAEAQGSWRVTFDDPPGATVRASRSCGLQLFSDVTPRLAGSPVFVLGQPTRLQIEMVDAEGRSIGRSQLTGVTVSAGLRNPVSGDATPLVTSSPGGGATFETTYTVPLDTTATYLWVDLVPSLSPAGAIPIAAGRRTIEVKTRLPAGYPVITPTNLRVPAVVARKSTSGVLTATGSDVAGGCVWVDGATLKEPNGTDLAVTWTPKASDRQSCVRVERGKAEDLVVQFTPSHRASGRVTGSVRVRAVSDTADAELVVDVPTTFAMQSPVTQEDLRMFAAIFTGGLLIPILILHGLNFSGARFEPPELVRRRAIPVLVAPGQTVRPTEPAAFDFDDDDFEHVGRGPRARRDPTPAISDGFTFRAKASGWFGPELSLFRGPYGTVRAGGQPLLAGTTRAPLRAWRKHRVHEVPLALRGTWMFRPTDWQAVDRAHDVLLDADHADTPWVEGELLLLIGDGGGPDQGQALLAVATAELPQQVARLRQPPPARWRRAARRARDVISGVSFHRDRSFTPGDGGDSGDAELDAFNTAVSSPPGDDTDIRQPRG